MNDELIYTGYRIFTSKKGTQCHVLDFITKPKQTKDNKRIYVTPASIFVDDVTFSNFISNTKLLSIVKVTFEIVGNSVRYQLA